jgi:hypothetical protein
MHQVKNVTRGSTSGIMRLLRHPAAERSFPVSTLPHLAHALHSVLTSTANAAARSTGFIRRQRAFSGSQFVQTLVFGWLAQPQASYSDLILTAASLGVSISPQGLAARLDRSAADCLLTVFQAAITHVVCADPVAIPLLDRFSAVYIQDSTTISLPDALAEHWLGCGGSHGRVAAALKAQVRLDLRTGHLDGPLLQDGCASDRRIAFASRPLRDSIIVRDLGYFELPELAQASHEQRYWLTRLYPGTAVFTRDGQRHDVFELVAAQGTEVVELEIQIGVEQRLACRLLAVRVPEKVAAERRERLKRQASKKGRVLSASSLAGCAWTLVVTNVAATLLTVVEAMVLMRVRWQIELLFKLWKSEGHVDESRRVRGEAVACEVYAKLIGMLIQHWLVVVSCWDVVERSLPKVARVLRRSVERLLGEVEDRERLEEALGCLQRILAKAGRQTPRRKQPNTYRLLREPDQLRLT